MGGYDESAGICGSDLSGYLGENSLRKPPLVMGHEFTGEIVAAGENIPAERVGEHVVVNPLVACRTCRMCLRGFPQYCAEKNIIGIHRPGGFAEFVTVPVDTCHLVADGVAGALVEPLACSVRAIRQANVRLGDTVVVFGAGIIGLFAVKIARLSGASRCILVDTNSHRLEIGTEFGATDIVNPLVQNPVECIQKISCESVQKVIDAVGLPVTRRQCVEIVESGGRIVLIGLHEDESLLQANVLVRKEIEMVGSFCYSDDDFHQALMVIKSGLIRPHENWLSIRSMEQRQSAFDEQIEGPACFPKIILAI